MPDVKMKRFKLGGKLANYTGVLNGVYPIKDGIYSCPDDRRDPKVLIEHYAAKRVITKEEAEAAAREAEAVLAAAKREEELAAKAKAEAEAKAVAETRATGGGSEGAGGTAAAKTW